MKLTFAIHTPGQAFFWNNIINTLAKRGHQLSVLTRSPKVVSNLNLNNHIYHGSYNGGGKTVYSKILGLPVQLFTSLRFISGFNPDIIIGGSMLEANSAAILRKPCIIFEDTEITPYLERIQWQTAASDIITPSCFRKNLGKKHIRIEGYKELAYLHPNYFQPDPSIFDELGIKPGEKYIIVRFNSFRAVHDLRLKGFSMQDRYSIVNTLKKYSRVFISAEGEFPEGLSEFKLPVPSKKIHHALYYAQMIFGDSGTMSAEAAILGTPAIRCNSGLGFNELGNFIELEKKYDLMYCIPGLENGLRKAEELLLRPDLKDEWNHKRQKLLNEKIDVTRFMVDFIEKYPASREIFRGR